MAPRPAAALASEWRRGPLRRQQGQGRPCPWEGGQPRVRGRLPSHLSLAATVTSQPSATRAAPLHTLLPASRSGPTAPARHAEGDCRRSPWGRLGVPRGICAEPLVPRGAGRGTRMWVVHSQTTLLPAPGSPPPTRAGGSVALRGSGEDAGLCPHGAHTPTPRSGRLRQPLLRAAVMTTPGPPSAHPAPSPTISIGNARPNGSHGVQRRDWNCIVSSFCNELPQSIS